MPVPAETLRVILTGKDELSPTMRQVRDGLKKLGLDITSVVAPAGIAAGAIAGMAVAGAKLFGDWQEYTLTIGDFAAKLGTTTEEASALTEMAGDLGVPLTSLQTAFKKMSKEGIDPSIEGLVAVRERLNAAKDPAEKLALATSLLGRAGADLIPVFDQLTNDELRNYIDTMGEGQVVTQREYELAKRNRAELDELTDTWKNLGLTVGGSIAQSINPPLMALSDLLQGNISLWEAWVGFFETQGLDPVEEAIRTRAVEPLQNARGAILGLSDEEVQEAFEVIQENVETKFVSPMEDAAEAAASATTSMQDWTREALLAGATSAAWNAVTEDGIVSVEEYAGMLGFLHSTGQDKLIPILTDATTGFGLLGGQIDTDKASLEALVNLFGDKDGMTTHLYEVTHHIDVYGGGSPSIPAPGGGKYRVDQHGGQLTPEWTLVGERGYELIDPTGYVHPHEESTRLLASLAPQGIQAGAAGVMIDGLVGVGGAYELSGAVPSGGYYIPPTSYGANPPAISAALAEVGAEGAGGPLANLMEEVQQAAAAESAALVASIPAAASAAASEQGRMQVLETRQTGQDTVDELRLVRREIAKLNRTLPTIVRDAVERVK